MKIGTKLLRLRFVHPPNLQTSAQTANHGAASRAKTKIMLHHFASFRYSRNNLYGYDN